MLELLSIGGCMQLPLDEVLVLEIRLCRHLRHEDLCIARVEIAGTERPEVGLGALGHETLWDNHAVGFGFDDWSHLKVGGGLVAVDRASHAAIQALYHRTASQAALF
jgi:hypothetical protein